MSRHSPWVSSRKGAGGSIVKGESMKNGLSPSRSFSSASCDPGDKVRVCFRKGDYAFFMERVWPRLSFERSAPHQIAVGFPGFSHAPVSGRIVPLIGINPRKRCNRAAYGYPITTSAIAAEFLGQKALRNFREIDAR